MQLLIYKLIGVYKLMISLESVTQLLIFFTIWLIYYQSIIVEVMQICVRTFQIYVEIEETD